MSEVGAADRTRQLRLKRDQLSGIVLSRKRKLRELYAVCDNEFPIPQIDLAKPDAPPFNSKEAQFLERTDILRERLFDESNLPTRRRLRSDKSKETSPIRKATPDINSNDASRKGSKLQSGGSKSRQSRAGTPSSRSDGGLPTAPNENVSVGKGVQMQRSSSKSSQTDLPAASSDALNEIVEESLENAKQPTPSMPNNVVPPKDLESDRVRRVESRQNSPGVDPRQAMPISAEDAANLPGPLLDGLGSHDGQHKAATIHLPPREVQERRLHERDLQHKDHTHLSINPPRDSGRNAEALSSPGSTIDALSATTPGMHEASTDTSPDNESRYDADRMDKDDEVSTPPQLRPTPEELQEKAEHDRILRARIEIAREEILRQSPRPADEPEEEQVAANDDLPNGGDQLIHTPRDTEISRTADEDSGMDVDDPEEVRANEHIKGGKQPEIADSEEDQTPTVEGPNAMDVDEAPQSFNSNHVNEPAIKTSVKDSFDSSSESPVVSPGIAIQPKEVSPKDGSHQSSLTPSVSTPRRTSSTPAPPRMTTRISSGAMPPKHISEILATADRRVEPESAITSHTPSRSITPQSPGARLRQLEKTNKERSKLSTVVFPGRTSKPSARDDTIAVNADEAPEDDYFMPLFLANATSTNREPLDKLLTKAHKTITTSNSYVPIHDGQAVKVLKKIYALQSSGKWSLRQPKRSVEPARQTTHWDVMLQEMKWMRTDFREERKWKMAVARNLASACAEWVEASPEDKKLLQVKAVIPTPREPESSKDVEMAEGSSQTAAQTPDLVACGASDSAMDDFEEEPGLHMLGTVAPAAIFALQDDEVVCGLRNSPITDKLLAELPMYGAPLRVPHSNLPTSDIDPDRIWKRPALPLSKYVEGRMELRTDGPPRKKSRFSYDEEDDDEDQVVFGDQGTKRPIVPAENSDVALFNPENKHIRDRIHSAHQFRPPSEFPMPLQSFFESRPASQWTSDEDVQLKSLVREYQYNWSLISSMLTSKSIWISGPERRTPWECFERWINLEGLPADMQKTHYFRTYSTRIDTANRIVMAQAVPPQPQQGPNGQVQQPARRRPTTSVRVERRRNNKHLTLVDAMRKLAKKRETTKQKQDHAQGLAAMRKAQEPPHAGNRVPIQTPQDFSRVKAEREEQFKVRLEELQRRQEIQRRALLQQQRNGGPQNPQQQAPNGAAPRPPAPGAPTNVAAPTPNQNLAVPGQNRPRPMPPQMTSQQPMQNGLRAPQMQPPAQMQGQLPLPNPALDVNLVSRAHQISQHQQAMIRQQQSVNGQNPQMHNSPPRMAGMPQPGFNMNGTAPMTNFNPNVNGVSTPPTNGHAQSPNHGQAGSPRMGQNLAPPNGMNPVNWLEMQFRQKYPNATGDQITRLISDHLANSVKQRGLAAQSAMNAAAGGSPGLPSGASNIPVPGMAQSTPQLYAQMLRQQQENQQKQQQAAQQAANAVGNGQNQGAGNAGQGHAHRASTGSAHSGK